ncbi:MAG: agmatine deiminase family protein, partial [Planctomycetaceae bacterium]|nr:agmatine deiminase family protein [Planctomycetaceae bacterium]
QQETEEAVLAQYRRLLPVWRIVPIDSQSLGRKLGSLHCATMNLPRLQVPLLHSDDES